MIQDLPSVADLVARIMTEAEDALKLVDLASKTRISAAPDWFTMDEAAPALLGARQRESGSNFWPTAIAVSGNPARPPRNAAGRAVVTGKLWSWTTNHYAPPSRTWLRIPSCPYTVCAVELETERWSCWAGLATGADPENSRSACRWSSRSARLRGRRARVRRAAMGTLGAAIGGAAEERAVSERSGDRHPRRRACTPGQVGPQLRRVRRRRRAGRAGATRASRGPTCSSCPARDTVRNGYPGYVAGADLRAGPRAGTACRSASSYAACASADRGRRRGRCPDPRRVLRRGARRRRRHDAQGLPRTEQGRARRRSRLAPLPPPRRDQPAPTSASTRAGAWSCSARRREDFAQVKVKNARHGLDNPYAR